MAMEQEMNRLDCCQRHINHEPAKQWYIYGCNEADDIAKFMFLWISLNWLYNADTYFKYREEFNHKEDDKRDPSEREQILNFVDDRFEQLRGFDVRKAPEFSIFYDQALFDARKAAGDEPRQKDYRKNDHRKLRSMFEKERIQGMFLTLYQVRCNLFHGSKRLKSGRDDLLIHSAAIILEGYLATIFRD